MKAFSIFLLAACGVLSLSTSSGQDRRFTFDESGNLAADFAANTASPQIVSHPQLQVVQPGALASFFVVAADTRGVDYQWRFNGTNLSGATNDALLLTNVSALDEGLYSIVLSNNSGSVTSSPAALMIDGDGDGLPDSWEIANFTNLNQFATGDFDGDGVSNLEEFLNGTNPANNSSALFKLTLISNGGVVDVSPVKLNYTNGEPVILTATAFAPEVFHGWTGDVGGSSNQVTLLMTGNKTVIAHFQPLVLTWTNLAGGSWHSRSNWSPNFVPLSVDDIVLPYNVTVTIDADAECRRFTLGTGTLTGSGNLTVHGDSSWTSGTMTGSGRTIIAPGATFTINSPSFTLNLARPLENGGTVFWAGAAGMNMNNAVITNRAGALFHAQTALTMGSAGGAPRFDNAGTFRKSVSTGTTAFNIPFNNYGDLDLQTGTLNHNGSFVNNGSVALTGTTHHRMAGGGSASGTFSAAPGSLVEWVGGTFPLTAGAQLNGTGTYWLNGATVNFDADVVVQTLELHNGTLGGSGTVTISNAMSWIGGTMSGSGRTIIAPGATFTINSPFFTLSLGRALENGGTTVWTGAPGMNLNNVVITNRPGALFHVQGAQTLGSGGGSPRFDNAGIFRKSSNSGTATFNVPFNDYGVVESLTGTLSFNGGGSHIGSFVVTNGTTLNFGGTHNLSGAASIVGAGNVNVSSGVFTHSGSANVTGINSFSGGTANLNGDYICSNNTVTVSGGVVNFNGTGLLSPSVVNLNGTLGGSSLITVIQQMNWTGGTMDGSGRMIIAPDATLTINSPSFTLNLARPLENGGTVVWAGAAGMNVNNAVITNRAGALFHAQTALTLGSSGGAPRFDNAGTFRKSVSAGTTAFNIPFNNYGDLDLQTGTLNHNGSFVNNGSVTLAAGTTHHRMAGGGSASGTFSAAPGSLVEWVGGTFPLTTGAQINGTGTYWLNGATVNFDTDVVVQKLELHNGTLGGSGTVTISNAMSWIGGTMSGSGRTIIAPGATMNMASPFFTISLTGRTLENGGTFLWTTAAALSLNNAVITNRAGALFHAQNSGSLNFAGGSVRFDNAGTFRKSAHAGTTTIGGFPFNNYGTVDIQTGTLLSSGSFQNNGAVTLAAGTTHRMSAGGSANGTFTNPSTAFVDWTGGTFTLNSGAQLNGAGQYQINGAAVIFNTDATVQLLNLLAGTLDGPSVVTIGNAMTWSSGTLSGVGRTVIAPGASFLINNNFFTITMARTLENGGTVNWTGAAVTLNNTVITNRAGALFHVQNAQSLGFGGGSPRFDNAGTLCKSGNTGTTSFGVPFNNYGTVDLRSGILSVNGGWASSSNAVLNCALGGTVAGSGYGQLQKSGVIALDGALSVDFLPGFTPATNDNFTVVTAGTRSGMFSSFAYPENRVTMVLTNTPTAVVLNTTAVLPVSQPTFLAAQLENPNVRLIWTATSNVTYRLEYNSDISSTNWNAVAGDITTVSNTASKLDAFTTSNRFYRVRILP